MKPRRQSRAPSQTLALLESAPKSTVVAATVEGSKPVPAPSGPRRDFGAIHEFVWSGDGRRVVVREQQAARDGGAHTYRAYEIVDGADSIYRITTNLRSTAYGRVDTRCPPRAFDPISEYSEGIDWLLAQQRNALDMIRALCPETVHVHGDAVFDGPGYVTMLTRPEARYAAVLAAVVPT